jgi:MFS family permease
VVGLPWALLILFVYGLNTSTGMVASNTILQTVIPDRVRGRGFTLLDVTWAAMRLLSLGVGGWLADRAGISSVYVIGGALLTLAGVLGLVLLGRVPLGAPSCATPLSGHATGAGLLSGSADRCGGSLVASAGRRRAGRRTPRRTHEGRTP